MPTEEEVQGRPIKTLKDWSGIRLFLPPVHFGRQGVVAVLGLDRECVAEALVNGAKKQGMLAEAKVVAAVKEIDDKAMAVGVLSSARAALDSVRRDEPSVGGVQTVPRGVGRVARRCLFLFRLRLRHGGWRWPRSCRNKTSNPQNRYRRCSKHPNRWCSV